MKRMNLKRSITAFSLAGAMAVSVLATGGNLSTVEAATSKQNVITQATYNSGDTVKYTYNKKGLVTKAVSTRSSKSGDSDTSVKKTTTYKYNKKNKITSKTAKTVTTNTYYDTDKTTGLTITGTQGKVTTTVTEVTKYTYNKKGLATQAVTTATTTKSGSRTVTSKSSITNDGVELSDGRVIAGYNSRNADGSTNPENTSANAYYYSGSIADTEGTETTTTTYTDNGNGTYTKTSTESKDTRGYKEEAVRLYYGYDNTGAVIPLTRVEDAEGYVHYNKADGTLYSGYNTFSVVTSVSIIPDATSVNSSSKSSETVVADNSVTTTKFTYDKKKRVKKAVMTTVDTEKESATSLKKTDSSSSTGSSRRETANKSEKASENTYVATTNYTYDKKGHAKKVVFKNDGVANSTSTSSSMTTNDSSEETTIYSDGTSRTETESYSYDTYPTVTTTVVKDGMSTTTTTENPYTRTYANSTVSPTSNTSTTGTSVVTTYGNGGSKTVNTYTTTRTSTDGDDNYTESGSNTFYSFDESGKSSGSIRTSTITYASNPANPSKYDSAYYTDGQTSTSGVEAMLKIDAAKGALEAAGTPFNKVETYAVLAEPSKVTTNYAYDKDGNVKSAKASGTYTEVEGVKNETYGNQIYAFDASGKTYPLETAVTHKFTGKDAMENTVKKGTKNLTKVYTVSTSTNDREQSSGSLISRVAYTLKSKKASASSVAKKQQWIIQNGNLNGEVGLN